jgi:hypothetical protein
VKERSGRGIHATPRVRGRRARYGIVPPARGRPGRGANTVSVANRSAARGTRPAAPAAEDLAVGGQAGDVDDGLVVDVDELEADLSGGRNMVDLISSCRTSAAAETAGGGSLLRAHFRPGHVPSIAHK